MKVSRRELLGAFSGTAGCFAVTAALGPLVSWAAAEKRSGLYQFPQGVASADPMPDAIVLWTRVVRSSNKPRPVELRVQMSTDEHFSKVIVQKRIRAEQEQDFTVRLFVDGLDSDRWYFYRFLAPDGSSSPVGRTRTAPAPDALRPLTAAVLSCQHYETGYFYAYRRLLYDDSIAAADRKIDLIIHLGDFVYDNTDVKVRDQNGAQVRLQNSDGSPRRVGDLPSGGIPIGKYGFLADSLEDYRQLYRVYLSDPDLQVARARYPFVCVWDDHEVRNDCWQSYDSSGPLQRQKVNGNQAWIEYMPAALTRAPSGPGGINPARDFVPVKVENVVARDFDDDYLSHERNNLLAIHSMTVFRTLQWGSTAELVLLDLRSYRGPRGLDAKLLSAGYGYPAAPVPPWIVEAQNAGRTANNGSPPEALAWRNQTLPNTRKDSPLGSMLGRQQKTWLRSVLKNSSPKWKVICSSVPFMRCGFDSTFLEGGVSNGLMWTDSWDGYPVERRELMQLISDNAIANVISLAGDRHAHYAGLVYDDYDAAKPTAVIPELVVAGVSATCRLKAQAAIFDDNPELQALVQFDGRKVDYRYAVAPSLNAWILYGADAARTLHDTGNVTHALTRAKAEVNPHLNYADCDAYGYCIVRWTSDRVDAEFVTVPEPLVDYAKNESPVRRRVHLGLPSWQGGGQPTFSHLKIEGEEPLLGLKWQKQE